MKKTTIIFFLFVSMFAMIGCSSDGVNGIEITQNPIQLTYNIGEELNLEGIVVKVIMHDGNKYILESDQYTVSGYDKTMSGSQTILITYGKHKQTFTVAVVDYNGPLFLGVEAIQEIPQDYQQTSYKPNTSINKNIASTTNEQPYLARMNGKEFLVILIEQPIDKQFEIMSIKVNERTYQMGAKENPADSNSRSVAINFDGSKVYIPITLPNSVGSLRYQVEAVKYIDGTEIKDVRKDVNAQDSITINVGNRPITNDFMHLLHKIGGLFDFDKREITFSKINNIDSAPIKEIWINGEQVPTSEPFMLQRGWVYKIPDDFALKYRGFSRIKLVYEVFPGYTENVEFFVTEEEDMFNIYDGRDLVEFLNSNGPHVFYIMNDIIIPIEFTGFTQTFYITFDVHYYYTGGDENITIGFEGESLVLFNMDKVDYYEIYFGSNEMTYTSNVIIQNHPENKALRIVIRNSGLVLNETIFINGPAVIQAIE